MSKLVGLAILALAGAAHADAFTRFGVTMGVERDAPEARRVGPILALGMRTGAISGEVEYAYLSMFDESSTLHRLGVALRADLIRHRAPCTHDDCRHSSALFGEAGAAERFGSW